MLDCPGYQYQALVTNLPESTPAVQLWRDYNLRANCEEVIKQLDGDFALPQLCLGTFYGTEAALSLAVLSYNLCTLFQRHLGWLDRVTASTLRFRIFTTGGIITRTGGITTIRLSVPKGGTALVDRGVREVIVQIPELQCSCPMAIIIGMKRRIPTGKLA